MAFIFEKAVWAIPHTYQGPPVTREVVKKSGETVTKEYEQTFGHYEKMVLLYFAKYCNNDGTSVYPSLTNIGNALFISRSRATEAVNNLEHNKLIKRRSGGLRANGSKMNNQYTLIFPNICEVAGYDESQYEKANAKREAAWIKEKETRKKKEAVAAKELGESAEEESGNDWLDDKFLPMPDTFDVPI